MEQALAAGTADQCWMLMQYSSSSTMNTSSSSSSWEEKAFAEDAAGHGPLGGCVWPPRSYSCSFCMREFRSAQALGGHMNVHRRDRARLKQCHLNRTTTISTDHHHHRSSKSLLGAHQKCPNFSSSSPVTRASSAAAALSRIQEINVAGDDHDHHQRAFLSSSSSTWSDSKPDQLEKIHMMRELQDSMWQGNICDDDYVETHLSVGLINSVVSGNISQVGSCGEEARSYKRPKTSISPFPFFLHSEVTGLVDSSSMEDLDLELRLGDPPKVK